MKLLLTGGGTAGHVNPALAIAEFFTKNDPRTEIFFAGTPGGMERELVAKRGYPYLPIDIVGFSRSLSLKNLRACYLAVRSPQRAKRILRELHPDLVVGTGGYVSWPMLSAAVSLGIPTALHESNAIPGLTVRRLASRVDLVLLNFPEAERALPKAKQCIHVGNPLRSGFNTLTREAARLRLGIPMDARVIVSFGGSLGAEGINRMIAPLWERYLLKEKDIWHIHAAGKRYFGNFQAGIKDRFPSLPPRLQYREYLEEMPLLMAASDLLLCRAGAITISEAARAGRASILIPSPHVVDDHQTKNAIALERLGASIMLKEESVTTDALIAAIRRILEDRGVRASMERAAAAFDLPDANRRIYRALCDLVAEKKKPTLV